jgi:hypothetical protein
LGGTCSADRLFSSFQGQARPSIIRLAKKVRPTTLHIFLLIISEPSHLLLLLILLLVPAAPSFALPSSSSDMKTADEDDWRPLVPSYASAASFRDEIDPTDLNTHKTKNRDSKFKKIKKLKKIDRAT